MPRAPLGSISDNKPYKPNLILYKKEIILRAYKNSYILIYIIKIENIPLIIIKKLIY